MEFTEDELELLVFLLEGTANTANDRYRMLHKKYSKAFSPSKALIQELADTADVVRLHNKILEKILAAIPDHEDAKDSLKVCIHNQVVTTATRRMLDKVLLNE